MNTIHIEPTPHGMIRCVLADQSAHVIDTIDLPDWLTRHPMAAPAPRGLLARLFG